MLWALVEMRLTARDVDVCAAIRMFLRGASTLRQPASSVRAGVPGGDGYPRSVRRRRVRITTATVDTIRINISPTPITTAGQLPVANSLSAHHHGTHLFRGRRLCQQQSTQPNWAGPVDRLGVAGVLRGGTVDPMTHSRAPLSSVARRSPHCRLTDSPASAKSTDPDAIRRILRPVMLSDQRGCHGTVQNSAPDMGNRAPPRQLRTTLIRRRRTNHAGLHVHGYKERGTTTPFDMVMHNDLDRYHLVIDTIDRVPTLQSRTAALRQDMMDAIEGKDLDP
jgi:hypothetical protein